MDSMYPSHFGDGLEQSDDHTLPLFPAEAAFSFGNSLGCFTSFPPTGTEDLAQAITQLSQPSTLMPPAAPVLPTPAPAHVPSSRAPAPAPDFSPANLPPHIASLSHDYLTSVISWRSCEAPPLTPPLPTQAPSISALTPTAAAARAALAAHFAAARALLDEHFKDGAEIADRIFVPLEDAVAAFTVDSPGLPVIASLPDLSAPRMGPMGALDGKRHPSLVQAVNEQMNSLVWFGNWRVEWPPFLLRRLMPVLAPRELRLPSEWYRVVCSRDGIKPRQRDHEAGLCQATCYAFISFASPEAAAACMFLYGARYARVHIDPRVDPRPVAHDPLTFKLKISQCAYSGERTEGGSRGGRGGRRN